MQAILNEEENQAGAVNHKCICCELQGKFENNLCNECYDRMDEGEPEQY